MDTGISKRVQVIGWLLLIFCIVGCVWIVVAAIITSQTTGILYLRSANSSAGLIISQNDRQALLVGTGTARVRLKPGSYQISAVYNGKQANGVAKVYIKNTTTRYLGALRSVRLPSVANISFEGTSALINNGLTIDQVNNLEQAFFHYKPSAQTVDINTGSVEPAPHNPNIDTSFTLNFTLSIDSVPYKAAVTYTDLESVQLYLYSVHNNALLFNSSTTNVPGGD